MEFDHSLRTETRESRDLSPGLPGSKAYFFWSIYLTLNLSIRANVFGSLKSLICLFTSPPISDFEAHHYTLSCTMNSQRPYL